MNTTDLEVIEHLNNMWITMIFRVSRVYLLTHTQRRIKRAAVNELTMAGVPRMIHDQPDTKEECQILNGILFR